MIVQFRLLRVWNLHTMHTEQRAASNRYEHSRLWPVSQRKSHFSLDSSTFFCNNLIFRNMNILQFLVITIILEQVVATIQMAPDDSTVVETKDFTGKSYETSSTVDGQKLRDLLPSLDKSVEGS